MSTCYLFSPFSSPCCGMILEWYMAARRQAPHCRALKSVSQQNDSKSGDGRRRETLARGSFDASPPCGTFGKNFGDYLVYSLVDSKGVSCWEGI